MTEDTAIKYMDLGLQSMKLQKSVGHPEFSQETYEAFKITVRLAKERIISKEAKTIISEAIKHV